MTTYTGNQIVDPGLYYAARPFKLTSIDEQGPLPGTADRTWHRVPMVLMLTLAPLLGLAFVIFLPLIGFVMVARMAAEKVAAVGARAWRPAWAPALAFLTRAKAARPDAPAATPDPWADDVERQVTDTNDEATKR